MIRLSKLFLGRGHVLVAGNEVPASYKIEGRSGTRGTGHLTDIDHPSVQKLWKEGGYLTLLLQDRSRIELKLGGFVSGEPIPVSSVAVLP